MKYILCIVILLASMACNRNTTQLDNQNENGNNFKSAEEAISYTINNLPQILSEKQKASYGFASDEDIKTLTVIKTIPVIFISFDELVKSADTALITNSENNKNAYLYSLGKDGQLRICVLLKNNKDKWIVSTIGMKKYILSLAAHNNAQSIIEFPGIEMGFVQLQDSSKKLYAPIAGYSSANINASDRYEEADLIRKLKNYVDVLDKKYQNKLRNGELDE